MKMFLTAQQIFLKNKTSLINLERILGGKDSRNFEKNYGMFSVEARGRLL